MYSTFFRAKALIRRNALSSNLSSGNIKTNVSSDVWNEKEKSFEYIK